jgi:hypothetical protein
MRLCSFPGVDVQWLVTSWELGTNVLYCPYFTAGTGWLWKYQVIDLLFRLFPCSFL